MGRGRCTKQISCFVRSVAAEKETNSDDNISHRPRRIRRKSLKAGNRLNPLRADESLDEGDDDFQAEYSSDEEPSSDSDVEEITNEEVFILHISIFYFSQMG